MRRQDALAWMIPLTILTVVAVLVAIIYTVMS